MRLPRTCQVPHLPYVGIGRYLHWGIQFFDVVAHALLPREAAVRDLL
jgi:hypothetical protein